MLYILHTISTRAIYRNMPPTMANIHNEADVMFPMATPISIPKKQSMEDIQLYIIACFADIPALNNTAKSPG